MKYLIALGAIASLSCSDLSQEPPAQEPIYVRPSSCVIDPEPPADPSTRDGHVVIMAGILGDCSGVRFCSSELTKLFDNKRSQLHQTLTSYVWPWHDVPPTNSLIGEGANQHRAELLAKAIAQWGSLNPQKRLYIVAGSGSGWLLPTACKQVKPDSIYRLVLLCTVLARNQNMERILAASQEGVYSYVSDARYDKTLGFLMPQSAGCKGFVNPDVHELKWTSNHTQFGNNGDHLDCYAPQFAESLLLPLFSRDPRCVPHAWND